MGGQDRGLVLPHPALTVTMIGASSWLSYPLFNLPAFGQGFAPRLTSNAGSGKDASRPLAMVALATRWRTALRTSLSTGLCLMGTLLGTSATTLHAATRATLFQALRPRTCRTWPSVIDTCRAREMAEPNLAKNKPRKFCATPMPLASALWRQKWVYHQPRLALCVQAKGGRILRGDWWAGTGSNRRHARCKLAALPLSYRPTRSIEPEVTLCFCNNPLKGNGLMQFQRQGPQWCKQTTPSPSHWFLAKRALFKKAAFSVCPMWRGSSRFIEPRRALCVATALLTALTLTACAPAWDGPMTLDNGLENVRDGIEKVGKSEPDKQ